MMSRFLSDDKAIAPIIAAALLLAIGVSMIGFIQMHYVPVWNAQEEMGHFEDVSQDMNALPASIENSVAFDAPRTNSVRMGLTYTKIPIFYNPTPTLFGTLEVTPTNNITISYTYGDSSVVSRSYLSNTIRFKLPDHADIVYEHGIIITDYSAFTGGNITRSQNTIIDSDNIEIPVLFTNGTDGIKISSVAPATIAFYPVQNTDTIRPANLNSVNITIETQYPFVWEKLLLNANTPNSSVRVNNVTKKIYINTSMGNEIKLPDTNQNMQLNRLYTGIISVKNATADTIITTTPSSSQDWSTDGVGGVFGNGYAFTDVPTSANVTTFNITNIIADTSSACAGSWQKEEIILFKVTDNNGNFWFVKITVDSQTHILSLIGRTSASGIWSTSNYTGSFSRNTSFDLLSLISGNAGYRSSNIKSPNALTGVWVGAVNPSTLGDSCLINYRLVIS